jgi:hypothetical protein
MTWTTARPNWVEDILAGRSMSPSFDSLPDKARAEKALTTFKMLRISDVPGRPTFGEVAEQWVFDFVAAVFGAHDPMTQPADSARDPAAHSEKKYEIEPCCRHHGDGANQCIRAERKNS